MMTKGKLETTETKSFLKIPRRQVICLKCYSLIQIVPTDKKTTPNKETNNDQEKKKAAAKQDITKRDRVEIEATSLATKEPDVDMSKKEESSKKEKSRSSKKPAATPPQEEKTNKVHIVYHS
jgi:hypothetical protein